MAGVALLAGAGGVLLLGARDAGPAPAAPVEIASPGQESRSDAGAEPAADPIVRPAAGAEVASGPATAASKPSEPAASPARQEDEPAARLRILVSLEKRMLWLVDGRDTLLAAPVAIGMGRDFEYEGQKYHFATPKGRRRVIGKIESPVWTPPEWHYKEKAATRELELVRLEMDSKVELSDGSFIVVVQDQVGRVTAQGYFHAFTPGIEIIFDDKIFMPPMFTAQRKVPDALGPYKLDTGNGYLIHGTHMYNEDSIGEAVSHGCVRMTNSDLEKLYHIVPIGTPVEIF